MILFFDTETTGKADFRSAPQLDHQPRLVQIGSLLCDDDGEEVSHFNLIIKPDGFEIPKEASDIHGITTERAMDCGVAVKSVLRIFRQFWQMASIASSHNFQFDEFIIDGEMFRAAGSSGAWGPVRETFCTMLAMTPICKVPGNYDSFKWPKLQEAHKHAFGVEFDGAHDAMADVKACARLYFWLQKQAKEVAV